MFLATIRCPECNSEHHKRHIAYDVTGGEKREIRHCSECGNYFSETKATPLEGLRKPLHEIVTVLKALNNGMSINAACDTFSVSKKSINRWLARLGGLQETLLLYSLCHRFIEQIIEGDELYTKVYCNKPPLEAEGWTIVLMDRASRFIWNLNCGQKSIALFEVAITVLAQVVTQTADLTLMTDGERRYGNVLFEICPEVVRTGKVGRPPTTLKKWAKVRIKNKGSQAHKKGPKRPKYQAPHPEHPETVQNIEDKDIHANHAEAFNSALRRKLSCYRRKTNMYAKDTTHLQIRLDAYRVSHNFVRPHFTTKQVPAVALGILKKGFTIAELFRIQRISAEVT